MAKANTGTTVKKVLLRIKRYWFFLILSILMAAVTVASSLYVPILIGNAIDYIIGPQNVEFKAITAILSEVGIVIAITALSQCCLLYTSPSPRDRTRSRMPSSA